MSSTNNDKKDSIIVKCYFIETQNVFYSILILSWLWVCLKDLGEFGDFTRETEVWGSEVEVGGSNF